MEINQDLLFNYLIYSKPIPLTENIICYPIVMENIVEFQRYSLSIMVRKDSIFSEKKIIKMQYLEFLYYANGNQELEEKYNVKGLSLYYSYLIELIKIVCKTDDIMIDTTNGNLRINGDIIDADNFDTLRRIIFIQNEVDFDIDEFMNIETLTALENAKAFEERKKKEKSNIEDYIDSLIISLKLSEEEVSKMSVRKFWRYIKRVSAHEDYLASVNGQMTGMVTFKEPIRHWMTSFEIEDDKYKNVKTDESELRGKIG